MRHLIAAASVLALAACGMNGTDDKDEKEQSAVADHMSVEENGADAMHSNDPAPGEQAAVDIPDPEERPVMQAQVVLDRHGFGPGVIDGKMGMSTKNAIEGFQEASELEVTGELDEATKKALAQWSNIPATRVVTIPADWGDRRYRDVPDGPPNRPSWTASAREPRREDGRALPHHDRHAQDAQPRRTSGRCQGRPSLAERGLAHPDPEPHVVRRGG